MVHILQLFGRSPFAPLQGHMEKVSDCVRELSSFFQAFIRQDTEELKKIAEQIFTLEHAADITKNEIRNHLPKTLFLQIDRQTFLEMLFLQDGVADTIEDIAVLLTIRPMQFLPDFHKPYMQFLQKNMECFEEVHKVIQELPELSESSFGGVVAETVKKMCEKVSFLEHEADILQRGLLQSLYSVEEKMSYGVYDQWQKVFGATGAISNISEKLANCVRMTLDIS